MRTTPNLIGIKPLDNWKLVLFYNTKEQRVFNFKPYLKLPMYAELKDEAKFFKVKLHNGTVLFESYLDFDPEVLYTESKLMKY